MATNPKKRLKNKASFEAKVRAEKAKIEGILAKYGLTADIIDRYSAIDVKLNGTPLGDFVLSSDWGEIANSCPKHSLCGYVITPYKGVDCRYEIIFYEGDVAQNKWQIFASKSSMLKGRMSFFNMEDVEEAMMVLGMGRSCPNPNRIIRYAPSVWKW